MMTSFTPTPEQLAIVEAARSAPDNLLISALAGAAKTSTLVLIAKALPSVNILCLAFNKRIAVEMEERLPGNCQAMTLNSLGHRVWAQAIGKRLTLSTDKNYKILSALIEGLPPAEKTEAYEAFPELLQYVRQGKAAGYVPTGFMKGVGKGLVGDDEYFAELEEAPSKLTEHLLREAAIESIKQAFQGVIDFDDQILMPTCFPAAFPSYPLVLVDEAQDLSALNHATLRKLVRKRLIAVGDECQAIYGFRGAHGESMAELSRTFSMTRLTLSISFRCPQAVVREAQWRAPHMQWPEWAQEGQVEYKGEWTPEELPASAAVICRNNAPLFSLAIALLRQGRYCEVVGNDIGKYLLKVMKKLGDKKLSREEALTALEAWVKAKASKHRDRAKLEDQAECIRIFLEHGDTLGDAILYAETIFAAKGPLQLMTIHKSKGLEFNDVFILDRHRIDIERDQDANVLYVAQTRAKNSLTYITMEDFR